MEDAKNQAADLAVNKMMQGGEFNKILEDIQNAAENKKRDTFAKKYALLVCNAIYDTNAGLECLHQTKSDLKNIRITTKMLNIADEDIFELVDVSHENLENTFETLADKIIAQVGPLGNFTGIGNNLKFQAGGVHWKNLKPVVFQMIEDGLIREEKRKVGKEDVDSIVLSDLDQIEVSISIISD